MSAPRRLPAPFRILGPQRFIAYAMALFLLVAVVQGAASLLFYEAIDRNALYEDHARRVAELLIVSDRVHRYDPDLTAKMTSSHYLDVRVANAPTVHKTNDGDAVSQIRRHIIEWEPDLAARQVMLDIVRGKAGRKDLVGSMALPDGSWLNFRSRDISSGWPIVLRAMGVTLAITMFCIAFGLYGLHLLATPLRRLSYAVSHVVDGDATPLDEQGPEDIRGLFRSFNEMQARISDLEDNQSRSFEAISHDLRTPISRLKLAADFVSDSDISRIVQTSADEMESMMMSLQRFLRAQHIESTASTVDLTALVAGIAESFGPAVTLTTPGEAVATTYREPLELALTPLIENALQYGTKAHILIQPSKDGWTIEIEDNGPGIAEAHFEAVLDPFFRGDEARARDTPGFGLGIPTAHRLLSHFGGGLSFYRNAAGGATVRITIPTA